MLGCTISVRPCVQSQCRSTSRVFRVSTTALAWPPWTSPLMPQSSSTPLSSQRSSSSPLAGSILFFEFRISFIKCAIGIYRQTRLTALDLISYCAAEDDNGGSKRFLHMSEEEIASIADTFTDRALKDCILFGIGIHHAGLNNHDRSGSTYRISCKSKPWFMIHSTFLRKSLFKRFLCLDLQWRNCSCTSKFKFLSAQAHWLGGWTYLVI